MDQPNPIPTSAAASAEPPLPDRTLESWKQIAGELGVTDRTAQNYEKEWGLPVERDGAKRVRISLNALRAWQASRLIPASQQQETPAEVEPAGPPVEPPRQHWWETTRVLQWWASVASVLVVILAVGIVAIRWQSAPGEPVAVRWQGPVLSGLDAVGRLVWQHRFPYPTMDPALTPHFEPVILDLNKDGSPETVLVYNHIKREAEGWGLYCLSAKGEVSWRIVPTRIVTNKKRSFAPPYVLRDFVTFLSPENDGTYWTAAAFVHHTDYPAVLLVIDSRGVQRGEYWHAGHLNSVKALPYQGKMRLFAGGVQHPADQAVLLMFDPKDVHGTAPPDSPARFQEMSEGTERAAAYFPRTALNRRTSQFNHVENLEVVRDTLQASVYEHVGQPEGYLIYSLTANLEFRGLTESVAFQNAFKLDQQANYQLLPSPEEMDLLPKQIRVVWYRH